MGNRAEESAMSVREERQRKILELTQKGGISTQEELAEKLKQAGFAVTQATISRDLRDLRLGRVADREGRFRYAPLQRDDADMNARYGRVFREACVSAQAAQNILVAHTVPGMAMAVGAALDAMQLQEIVGCIAGDDTLFAVTRTPGESEKLAEKLRRMMG